MLMRFTINGRQRFFTKIARIPPGCQNPLFEPFFAVLQDSRPSIVRRRYLKYEKTLDFGGQIWFNSINSWGMIMKHTNKSIREYSSLISTASYAIRHLTHQRNNEMRERDSAG